MKEDQLNHVRKLETLDVGTDKETTKVGVRFICKRCVAKQFGGCDMYADENMVPSSSIHGEDMVENQLPLDFRSRITDNCYIVMVQSQAERDIGSNGEKPISCTEQRVETQIR